MSLSGKEHLRNWRYRQKIEGLCLDCKNPVAINLRGKKGVFCQAHRELYSARYKARRWAKHGQKELFSLDAFIKIDPISLAYAGALIDGEGHIKLRLRSDSGKWAPQIKIGMTDQEPVQFMSYIFGGPVHFYDYARGGRKPCWQWAVCGRRAGAIAKAVLPYLKIASKIREARFIVEYAATMNLLHGWRVKQDEALYKQREDILLRLNATDGVAYEMVKAQ